MKYVATITDGLDKTVDVKWSSTKQTKCIRVILENEFDTSTVFVLISAHAPISAHPGRYQNHLHKHIVLEKHIGSLPQFYT